MSNESLIENIKKHGWQCQYVFDANGEKEDFSYSIGFEESFDHPEIMIFGLKRETMHSILSGIASDIKEGRKFEEGVRTGNVLSGEFEVIFKSVNEEFLPEYAGIATSFYNKPFRMMVMFWPDKSNILPTEVGCKLTVQNEALKIV
ncbi:DUF4262 domain-containing protein [Saccharophagus degradans]|uniref:DUF4262 domain-containing protein n=1 Tax=Saccharophagus degradans (strain 2-40 / ATCC 43961 / DSM 17024) TaxID=203122 RepID=Q21I72_SACD2|nr:DUF4262 domain-containing protein [Saccharophagus degradans]ABD81607.1 hypothetical protein Sde_2347 [Saccharophagus degradans 2-40]